MMIKVKYHSSYGGGGIWVIVIDRGSYTLTRPLRFFVNDKSWDGFNF